MKQQNNAPEDICRAVVGHAPDCRLKTVEWLWKPYIPFGKVTIVQGDGGEGKTTLMLAVAALASIGQTPPAASREGYTEANPIEPLDVFYASTEEEICDSAIPRFVRNGGDINRFWYSRESSRHIELTEQYIDSIIAQVHARLLIIDPFQAFLPKGTQLNNVVSMRHVFTSLSNTAQRNNCAIVLIGHINKSEGQKGIHRGFGTADIAASVRSILLVGIDENDEDVRVMSPIKSNFDERWGKPVRFSLDDQRRVVWLKEEMTVSLLSSSDGKHASEHAGADSRLAEAPESRRDESVRESAAQPSSKLAQAVTALRAMLADGDMYVNDIMTEMEKLGIGRRTVERAKPLAGVEHVIKDGRYYWRRKE